MQAPLTSTETTTYYALTRPVWPNVGERQEADGSVLEEGFNHASEYQKHSRVYEKEGHIVVHTPGA